MISFFLIFSEILSLERLEWVSALVGPTQTSLHIGITGDALYSLNDARFAIYWKRIIQSQECYLTLDRWEAEIRGLTFEELTQNFSKKSQFFFHFSSKSSIGFWEAFINAGKEKNRVENYMGFLQMEGPYMDRSSVYALRFLEASLNTDTHAQLFCYLDGIHMGHVNQLPSEFENIGQKFSSLFKQFDAEGTILKSLVCSRCGTARGYNDSLPQHSGPLHQSLISGFHLCNLNEIVDKFEKQSPILAANVGYWYHLPGNADIVPPEILLLISHTPYQEEYTFGGLSFAMACANHGIHISVIFIEEGVYSLVGRHQIHSNDHFFNIQEIIDATWEMENLDYFVYLPSLDMRNISIDGEVDYIKSLSSEDLSDLMTNLLKKENSNMGRIIYF